MHSMHGQGSFITNSSISEVWHGSAQCSIAKALLSLQLFLLKTSHRFRSGVLAGQSSTVISLSGEVKKDLSAAGVVEAVFNEDAKQGSLSYVDTELDEKKNSRWSGPGDSSLDYGHNQPRIVGRTTTRKCTRLSYATCDQESDWSFRLAHWSVDGILTTEQGKPLSDDRIPSRTERRIEALCQKQCPKEGHVSWTHDLPWLERSHRRTVIWEEGWNGQL